AFLCVPLCPLCLCGESSSSAAPTWRASSGGSGRIPLGHGSGGSRCEATMIPFRKYYLHGLLALVLCLAAAGSAGAQEPKSSLFMVTAGISTYKDINPLQCAAKDAWDMGHLYQDQEGKLFHRVSVTGLANFKATSGNILSAIANV